MSRRPAALTSGLIKRERRVIVANDNEPGPYLVHPFPGRR